MSSKLKGYILLAIAAAIIVSGTISAVGVIKAFVIVAFAVIMTACIAKGVALISEDE